MRHRKSRSKLSMKTSHRKAALKSMVTSLFKYQRINMITARAKEVRRLAEHLITLAKTDTVDARRRAYAILQDRDLVGKLFKEIVPLCKSRTSGYTRIIPLGFRRGDGASMCFLELTDKKIVEKLPKKKKAKTEEAGKPVAETKKEDLSKASEAPKEEKHKEPKAKTIQKTKPTLDEEKRAEKARSEDKKLADNKGFMKNVRGFFRKRGDF